MTATILSQNQRVLDRVMEFCDRATLRSCALVCRSWIPHARFLLFDDSYAHLKLDDDADNTISKFQLFVLASNAPNPGSRSLQRSYLVADLITHLEISGVCRDNKNLPRSLTLTSLEAFILPLPRLKGLKLVDIKIVVDMDSFLPFPNASLHNLALLNVVASCPSYSNELAASIVLSCFPLVQTLFLGSPGCFLDPIAADTVSTRNKPESVSKSTTTTAQEIDSENIPPLSDFCFVTTTPLHYTLTRLTINCNSSADILALRAFLSSGAASESLKTLVIEISTYPGTTVSTHDLQKLRSYERLESFTLRLSARNSMAEPLQTILTFLEFLPPYLVTYNVEFTFGKHPTIDPLQELDQSCFYSWLCLDLYLSEWRALQRVNVLVSMDLLTATVTYLTHASALHVEENQNTLQWVARRVLAVVRSKLPRVAQRGILNATISYFLPPSTLCHYISDTPKSTDMDVDPTAL